ncbi:hypothetical protein LUU34_00362400 [Aix galericulata]|nr:hypothetical protein LUU34_00362400 [Aix galericulata]
MALVKSCRACRDTRHHQVYADDKIRKELKSPKLQRMETLTLSLIFPPASSLSASILMENPETFFDSSLIIRNLV